jgi:hypothetical protein
VPTTLVTARNPWASSISSPTVSGVTFTACAPPGWSDGGWTSRGLDDR